MRVFVYVDGFNLFYGSLKKTKYKWLDINKLVGNYFPNYEIVKIKYFSALTKARKNDLDKPNRQQMYFRALKTNPNIEIILGSFLENEVKFFVPERTRAGKQQKARVFFLKSVILPLVGYNFFHVIKTEEKGSDVNLGAHLVMDAYEKKFDVAVVISNDSDLVEPIRIVNGIGKLRVRLLNPYPITQEKLKKVTAYTGVKYIRKGTLGISQFPENMSDSVGSFYMPPDWK